MVFVPKEALLTNFMNTGKGYMRFERLCDDDIFVLVMKQN